MLITALLKEKREAMLRPGTAGLNGLMNTHLDSR